MWEIPELDEEEPSLCSLPVDNGLGNMGSPDSRQGAPRGAGYKGILFYTATPGGGKGSEFLTDEGQIAWVYVVFILMSYMYYLF